MRKTIILYLIIVSMLASGTIAAADNFTFITNGGEITFDPKIITGTNISCLNVVGASYDVCVGGGSGGTGTYNETDESLNATGGILGVNRSVIQNRVDGTCPGQAMQTINEDGTVVCVSIIGGNVTGFNSTDNSLNITGLKVGVNISYIQKRVTTDCGNDNYMSEIGEDGIATCQADENTQLSQTQVWDFMNVSKFFQFIVDWNNIINTPTFLNETLADSLYLRLDTTNNPVSNFIIINSTDPDGAAAVIMENDEGHRLDVGVRGSNWPSVPNVEGATMGLRAKNGTLLLSTSYNQKIYMGGTPTDNDSLINFSIAIDPTLQAIEFQGNKYIRPALLEDGSHALLFQSFEVGDQGSFPYIWVAQDSDNDTIVPMWLQNGKNNSVSSIMNSFGPMPKSWLTFLGNVTDDVNGSLFLLNRSNYINYCDYLQNNLSLVPEGCRYAADTSGRKVPLIFAGDLEVHRTATIHEGLLLYDNFNFIDRNTADFDLLWTQDNSPGALHIRAEKTIEANISEFNQLITDFEGGDIDPFVSESISPEAGRDWTNIDSYSECHNNLCSRAQGSVTKTMSFTGDTTFISGTVAAEDILLQFYYAANLGVGDNFSVIIDDNKGNVSTIFSTATTITDTFINVSFPVIFENKSNITTTFNFIGSNINREVFVDEIRILATPSENIIINETYRGGKIKLGDDNCYIENKRVFNNVTQATESQMQLVCDSINLVGDITQTDVNIISQNATGDIEAENLISRNDVNGTTFYGSDFWDGGTNLLTEIGTKADPNELITFNGNNIHNGNETFFGTVTIANIESTTVNSTIELQKLNGDVAIRLDANSKADYEVDINLTTGNDICIEGGNCLSLTGTGSVTSVSAGNGMDFVSITASGPVTLGVPSTLTSSTTNALTATSHTHAITESGFSIAASQITTGTFGAGDYTFPQNVTINSNLDVDDNLYIGSGRIHDNGTHLIID